MRTKSAQVNAVIANPSHSARAIVTVYNSAGTVATDLSGLPQGDPVLTVEVSRDIDSFRTAKVTVQRQQGLYSLAPTVIAGNPLYNSEPVIGLRRRIVIEAELQLPDISATPAGLRETIFDGWIDELQWPTDEMELVCTDKSAQLRDTWIERERIYGYAQGANATKGVFAWRHDLHALALDELVCPSKDKANGHFYKVTTASSAQAVVEPVWPTGSGSTVVSGGVTFTEAGAVNETGTALETIIGQVLADNGLSAITLVTPVSPGWLAKPFIQQRESVMSALQAMVDQLGWWIRFEWDAASSSYKLTLAEPARTSSTVHKVLDQVEEEDCDELGYAVWDIRNVVRVIYGDGSSRDPAGNAVRIVREVSDAASITAFGRRFMEIAEGGGSMIDTAAEADRLANAALADLKDPIFKGGYSFPVDFYLELGDRITLPADTLRYTTAQTLAIGSITDAFNNDGTAKTTVTLRGAPAAHHAGWLELDGRINQNDVHQVSLLQTTGTPSITSTAAVGGQRIQIKGDRSKGALPQGYEIHVSDSPGFTPVAGTLVGEGLRGDVVVPDLVPGKTYYAQLIATSRNASRIVRGEPSNELSFVAGRAGAGHLDSRIFTKGPLNGKFQTALDSLASFPPDHWELTAGAWAKDCFWSSTTTNGRYVTWNQYATSGTLRSSAWAIPRGVTKAKMIAVLRPHGTLSAGRGFTFSYEFFAEETLTTAIGTTQVATAPYTMAVETWAEFTAEIDVPAGANFVRVSLTKESASSAYGWDCAGVFFEPQIPLIVEAWTAPTFAANYGDNGGGWMPAGYYKGPDGRVVLRGLVKITTGTLTAPVWTFPTGYRPTAGTHQFPLRCGDGTLSYLSLGTNGILNFGGTLAQGQAGFMTEFSFDTR